MKINEKKLYLWAKDLYPIHRSITGSGVRETLSYIKKILPALKIKKIPSGKKVYGWKVPKEWAIKEAYIKNSKGKKVVDLKNNNLHIISYSQSINKHLSLENLKKNLYSLKEQPKAIPYITSYYSKNWGDLDSETMLLS